MRNKYGWQRKDVVSTSQQHSMDGGQAGEVKCGEQLRSVDSLQEALTLPRYFDLQPLLFFFFPFSLVAATQQPNGEKL